MTKTGKIIVGIIVIVVIVWLVVANTKSSTTETAKNAPIKIGFIAALSGDAATYGNSTKGGVVLAVKEINEAGGINGRQLEVVYEDGKCNNKDALTSAQKLVNIDKVKYIIGMPCSGEVLGVAPFTEANKVLIMVQGSSPDIGKSGKYIVRTFPSDLYGAQTLAEHSLSKNLKTAAVITETTDYATALDKAFQEAYIQKGGKVVASEQYPSTNSDFRTILAKIKPLNPDLIVLNAQVGKNAALMAKQARDLGIKSQFYGLYFTGPELVESGAAVNGTYIIDVPSLNPNDPKSAEVLKNYETINGAKPTYPFFAAAAYDQTHLLAKALSANKTEDVDVIRNYLHTMEPYMGVIGNFSFEENGDVNGVKLRLVQIKDNKVVDVQ